MSRLTERELDLIRRERQAAERETGPQAEAGFLAVRIVESIRQSLRRRRTVAELNRLDDRMLSDIGLTRGSLEIVADEMLGHGRARATSRAQRETGLLAVLRRWRRRQATIGRLASLDDRILQDIGVLRGDIANTVDRAIEAEDAVPAGIDALLQQATRITAPRPQRPQQRPLSSDTAALHARSIAEHAMQVASRRQAS